MDTFILLILASIVTGVLSLTVAVVLITRGTWTAYLIKFGTPFAAGVLPVSYTHLTLPTKCSV